ncbi:helix-turn-helix domain-containing protein [Salmonella enterica subsp. enterica]|nr:helix-turn-helix domain-containing protein [Salmonella enterica subsp. enterica]
MLHTSTFTADKYKKVLFENKINARHIKNVHVLRSTLIKLTHGKIVITNAFGRKFSKVGPAMLFIGKNQEINIELQRVDSRLLFSVAEIDSCSMREACEIFMQTRSSHFIETERLDLNIMSASIPPGGEDIFESLIRNDSNNSSNNSNVRSFSLIFILSAFLECPGAIESFYGSMRDLWNEKVYNIIASDVSRRWTLKDIADNLYVSTTTLKRKLASEDSSFSSIYLNARMNYAARLLRVEGKNITQVSLSCGYDSPSYFTSTFKKHFKITPSEFVQMVRNTYTQ